MTENTSSLSSSSSSISESISTCSSEISGYSCSQENCLFVCSTVNDLLKHYKLVQHPNFYCICVFEDCNYDFTTVSALKSHIYRHHRQHVLVTKGQSSCENELQLETNIFPEDLFYNDEPLTDLQADIDRLYKLML